MLGGGGVQTSGYELELCCVFAALADMREAEMCEETLLGASERPRTRPRVDDRRLIAPMLKDGHGVQGLRSNERTKPRIFKKPPLYPSGKAYMSNPAPVERIEHAVLSSSASAKGRREICADTVPPLHCTHVIRQANDFDVATIHYAFGMTKTAILSDCFGRTAGRGWHGKAA